MNDGYPWTCESFSAYLNDKNFFDKMIKNNQVGIVSTYDDMFSNMLEEAANLDVYLPDANDWDYEYYFYHLSKQKLSDDLEIFYKKNADSLDEEWEEKLSYGEWGSGEDKVKITDDMFWEFVESKYFNQGE